MMWLAVACVLFAVSALLLAKLAGKGKPPSGVELFFGEWGSGKTLVLVREALRAFSDPKCLAVYSTFAIWDPTTDKRSRYLDPDDLVEQVSAVRVPRELVRLGYYVLIVLDEWHILMDARGWAALPVSVRLEWAFGRKHGWVVRGSSQGVDQVEKTGRNLMRYVGRCRAYSAFTTKPWLVTVSLYRPGIAQDASERTKKERRVGMRRYWFISRGSRRAFAAYDTLEPVKPPSYVLEAEGSRSRGRRVRSGASVPAPDLRGGEPFTTSAPSLLSMPPDGAAHLTRLVLKGKSVGESTESGGVTPFSPFSGGDPDQPPP